MPNRLTAQKLLAWFDSNKRDLPWRRTTDPYRIWVSEVMLQQTQVQTVVPYYQKLLAQFPTVESLARAPERSILKAWEGLGYYSRARNLHAAAKIVSKKFGGQLPQRYEQLLELPGFGPYIAAAVASIAFGEKKAVVDGNAARVLARLYAKRVDVKDAGVRKKLQITADELIGERRPGDYNQALMELGATICVPNNPRCLDCPLRDGCLAFQQGLQNEIPLRVRRPKNPAKKFDALLLRRDKQTFLVQRKAKGLLQGLWELPIVKKVPAKAKKIGVVEHAYSHFTSRTTIWSANTVPKGVHGEWVHVPPRNHALAGWTAKALHSLPNDSRHLPSLN